MVQKKKNRNARLNSNQITTYYQPVSYLPRIQQYPVDNTYKSKQKMSDAKKYWLWHKPKNQFEPRFEKMTNN